MRYIFKLFKPALFVLFVFTYLSSINSVFIFIYKLLLAEIPYKSIVLLCIIVYFIYLAILFLLPKIYFEKSVFNSLIWAGILNILILSILGYSMNKVYNANLVLNIDFQSSFEIFNLMINYKGKTTEENIQAFKIFASIFIYIMGFLVVFDVVVGAILIIKYKSNKY